MAFWDFHQTPDRHWQWRYVSENTGSCLYGGRFHSRNDCIADAMRHGYLSDETATACDAKPAQAAPERKELHAHERIGRSLHRLLTF